MERWLTDLDVALDAYFNQPDRSNEVELEHAIVQAASHITGLTAQFAEDVADAIQADTESMLIDEYRIAAVRKFAELAKEEPTQKAPNVAAEADPV